MPYDATTIEAMTIDGANFSRTVTDKAQSVERVAPALAPAIAGTLATDTGGGAGSVTLPAGHALVLNETLGLFWTAPAAGFRMGANVDATPTATEVDFSGGHGDPLPPVGTPVTVALAVPIPFTVSDAGGSVVAIGLAAGHTTRADLLDAGGAVLASLAADDQAGYLWRRSSGIASPLAGGATKNAQFANGSTMPVTAQLAAAFNPHP